MNMQGVIFVCKIYLLLHLMKGSRTILSITSGFLIILLMIGSTGAVIVKHTCISCGLSDLHTEIFSSVHTQHSCDCEKDKSSCHNHEEEALQNNCCTFISEKLSLKEYNQTTPVNLSVVLIPASPAQFLSYDDPPEKPSSTFEIRNKHGGRDILRSNCQLTI
ncbi:MAG TPA: hypothetical protein DDY34_11935 [Bacteroidales bacterium]|nr:MAG: hypothetical protein A2X06_03030 [Bacteroidetes bacterium GWC2_40_22]HAM10231.1 hypothetical protein [Bacteroidales bacterium]HBH84505.1 hypothetical protein [Bacteroidales bacterium]HBQ82473.1 hypothetical protein [Bacteroidales bacterium]